MSENTRTAAAQSLLSIIEQGRSLDSVLAKRLAALDEKRDRAYVQELVYGVLRWYWRLRAQLEALLHRPLRKRDRDVEMLLLIGLYQLRYLSTARHAAVSETVAACEGLRKTWARGLVNATLRNAVRRNDELAAIGQTTIGSRTSHPGWFVNAVAADWPEHYESLLDANNERPPFTLRINRARTTRDDYIALLDEAGMTAARTVHSDCGISLDEPVPVDELPGFDAGLVSVQDEAAQLAASVLQCDGAGRVLDACAAPGGKTAHLLEQHPGAAIVAIDRVPARTERLEASLTRLRLTAEVHTADASRVEDWWDGVPFDRILIDAPCSGSGVIRRHPDIKHHRRADDIARLADQQGALLDSLWPLLGAGGKLVYATCSVLAAENDEVVHRFIDKTHTAAPDTIDAAWGLSTRYGRQVLTGSDNMDGFYYARLRRNDVNE